MLDGQRDLERAQGYRGPATRFFGPIDSASEANIVLREMCVGVMLFSLVVGVSSFRVGVVGVIAALIIAIPAALLFVSRHRAAAIGLVLCATLVFVILLQLRAVRGILPLLLWIALLIMAGRASRATFKLHEFTVLAKSPAVSGRTDGV